MDNKVMNDAEFGKKICQCKDTKDFFALLDSNLSSDQYQIAISLVSVCAIGVNGKLYHGISRLIEAFPRNFRGNGMYGKLKQGNKPLTDNRIQANIATAKEVKRLIDSGTLQKDACEEAGMSETNYKNYRKKLKND